MWMANSTTQCEGGGLSREAAAGGGAALRSRGTRGGPPSFAVEVARQGAARGGAAGRAEAVGHGTGAHAGSKKAPREACGSPCRPPSPPPPFPRFDDLVEAPAKYADRTRTKVAARVTGIEGQVRWAGGQGEGLWPCGEGRAALAPSLSPPASAEDVGRCAWGRGKWARPTVQTGWGRPVAAAAVPQQRATPSGHATHATSIPQPSSSSSSCASLFHYSAGAC